MFRKLVSVDEAKRILTEKFNAKPVGKEAVSLSEAHNRVLAEDVVSDFNIPPFSRSTVDGYALIAADTHGAEENRSVALKLIGRVKIGAMSRIKVRKGTLVEIVTGAPIPEGADAAVMMEYTELKGNSVLVRQAASVGENVMKAGSDISKGKMVLTRNVSLGSYQIGVLAAIGRAQVSVYRKPRVAIFSTGAEIVEPGKRLPGGRIFDINAHSLSAAVRECGGQPLNMGVVQDKTAQMEVALRSALKVGDAVITSGGVSVGPTDVIPKVLDGLGKPGVIVYGVAIRPGKPTTIAVIGGKPVFSLPGHPTSALMIFHLFVQPVLTRMTGRSESEPIVVKATTSEKLFPSRGRRTYITVTLKRNAFGKIIAEPVPTGLSGAITTLADADGFTVISENQQFVEKGQMVDVELLKPSVYYSLMRESNK